MTEEEFSALAEPVTEELTDEDLSEDTAEDTEDTYEPIEETEESIERTEEQDEETKEEHEEDQEGQPEIPNRKARTVRDTALEREYREAFNKINPYNGRPIQSPEDFFAYKRQYNAELERHRKQQKTRDIFDSIRNGTASAEDFDRYVQELVNNSPNMRASKALAAKMEQMERQSRVESGRARLQADIDALNREYPACEIKKVEDIKDSGIVDYLKRGLSVADAYYLTHRNEMMEAREAGVRQAAVNQANSKKHLRTTADNSRGEEHIPDDVLAEYKNFFPEWDDKKIIADYKRRHK